MFSLVHGFVKWLIARDEARILLVGLDGAGKTTFLEHVVRARARARRPRAAGGDAARARSRLTPFPSYLSSPLTFPTRAPRLHRRAPLTARTGPRTRARFPRRLA
jgi:hypothetical protein